MKKAVLLLTIISASNLMADTQLLLGEGIKVHAVNGSERVTTYLTSNRSLNLPKGTNQLLVSYTAEIKNGNDYELEQSHPSVLLFSATQQTISLLAPSIKTTRQLEKFNQELNWKLESNNTKVPFEVAPLPLKGFRLGINFERELEDFNRSNNTASHKKTSIIAQPNIKTGKLTDDQIKLVLLKSLYQQASPVAQKAFKEFIK